MHIFNKSVLRKTDLSVLLKASVSHRQRKAPQ